MKEQLDQISGAKVLYDKNASTLYKPSLWERIVAIVCAVIVMQVVLILVLRDSSALDPNQVILIRIVLSLSIAIIGAVIPGFLNFSMNGKGLSIRAGGALALFVITYWFTPKVAPTLETELIKLFDEPSLKEELLKLNRRNRLDLFDIEYVNIQYQGDDKTRMKEIKLPSREDIESIYKKKLEIEKKYDNREYSEADMEAEIEEFIKKRDELDDKINLIMDFMKMYVPDEQVKKVKFKVLYRMKYKGNDDLESITIYFGLYDKNETRLLEHVHARQWVKGKDVLSEIVEIRTDNSFVAAKAKIDAILIDKSKN